MTKNNDVAVIISIYKNDNFLYVQEAFNSLFKQIDISPLILVYIDGEIPTNIYNYLNDLSRNQSIDLSICNENKGLAFALNFLIEKALSYPNIMYMLFLCKLLPCLKPQIKLITLLLLLIFLFSNYVHHT